MAEHSKWEFWQRIESCGVTYGIFYCNRCSNHERTYDYDGKHIGLPSVCPSCLAIMDGGDAA